MEGRAELAQLLTDFPHAFGQKNHPPDVLERVAITNDFALTDGS
jgi:hypothetical protein